VKFEFKQNSSKTINYPDFARANRPANIQQKYVFSLANKNLASSLLSGFALKF
jgi:hypothetical protein